MVGGWHQVLNVPKSVGEARFEHHLPANDQRRLAVVRVLHLDEICNYSLPELVQRDVFESMLGQPAAAVGAAVKKAVWRRAVNKRVYGGQAVQRGGRHKMSKLDAFLLQVREKL